MNNLWLEEWKQTTIFSNTLWFSNLNISNWPYVSIKHTRENTKQELLSFNSPIILFLTLIPACSFTYLSRNRWWEINCLLTKFHFNKKNCQNRLTGTPSDYCSSYINWWTVAISTCFLLSSVFFMNSIDTLPNIITAIWHTQNLIVFFHKNWVLITMLILYI